MLDKLITSNLKLGIIAGGQLGKMLIQEASKWGITTYILDPDEACAARDISSVYVQGNFKDYETVYAFGKRVDILTFELEDVNIEALQQLKKEGHNIVPDPDVLALIQDKGLQKEFYNRHNIPTSNFNCFANTDEIKDALENDTLHYPFVQKLRKGGYDGYGVAVIDASSDSLLDGASMVEEKVDIEKEIAILVARNNAGEVRCFPAVEMVFNHQTNMVEDIICPANMKHEDRQKANDIAIDIIEKLEMTGLLAIEFFIDTKGNLMVNEVAPRPHNSGHFTIDSVLTSQLEQQLRAILNLPLGSTRLTMPTVMVNLLGEETYHGPVVYEGFKECLAIEGVKIHLYGKKDTRPFRKMGHVTILSDSIESALEKAEIVKSTLKVKA